MNIKKRCVSTNPAGILDTMCELVIESTAMLQIRDIIKSIGTYTIAGWIYADASAEVSIMMGDEKCDANVNIIPGWNRILLTVNASNLGSVYIKFPIGSYKIYRLQINQGNTPSAYEGESAIKSIVFGYDNNIETVLYNESDDIVGLVCRLHLKNEVTTPKVYIVESNEYIEIQGTYRKSEVIEVDTRVGHKSIMSNYHGVKKNLINMKTVTSKWLSLNKGINHVGYTAESGAEHMLVEIRYSNEYEGV